MANTTDNKTPAAAAAAAGAAAAVNKVEGADREAGGNLNRQPQTGALAGDTPEGLQTQEQQPPNIGPGGAVAPTQSVMDATDAAGGGPLVLYTVLIDRDANTKIPEQVLGYEIEVLLEIYGEDRVFVIEEHEEIDSSTFDVGRAFDGLVTKYKKYEAQRSQVYANVRELAKACGLTAPRTTAGQRDQKSMQKIRRPNTATAARATKSTTAKK